MNALFYFTIHVIHFYIIHAQGNGEWGHCIQNLDLAFALDSSYSVGIDNFKESIELVKTVGKNLDIRQDIVRIALIQFSDSARVEFYLNESSTIQDIVRKLDETNYTEGNTETGSALKLLKEDVFTPAHGDRPGVADLVVLVTDGPSSDHDVLVNQSSLLSTKGVTVIAVSVGFLTHPEELRTMAGERIIRATSYADLLSHAEEIMQLICDVPSKSATTTATTVSSTPVLNTISSAETNIATSQSVARSNTKTFKPPTSQNDVSTTEASLPKTTPPSSILADCQERAVDIIFVIDSSNSVGVDNFRKTKAFLTTVVDSFTIGAAMARFGVIVFSDDANLVIRLDEFANNTALKSAIQNIPYMGGGTNTASALKLLGTTAFSHSPRNGGIPKVGVVLTDGLSRNTQLTRLQAEQLHAIGIMLFAIGIGDKVLREELETIGSKPGYQFVVAMADFNALSQSGPAFIASACQTFPRWSDLLLTIDGSSLPGVTSAAMDHKSSPTAQMESDPHVSCFDVHENCHAFGGDVCSDYEQWARAHCAATCRFCAKNITEETCEDNIRNCREYGIYICEDPYYSKWVWKNCAAHCGLCESTSLFQRISFLRRFIRWDQHNAVVVAQYHNAYEYIRRSYANDTHW
ncbi:collagen alpha-1(xii) chain-like [Plakobranchus ocellatus]|uniref:Collagen alpha-1(Xii) chain-like n=1 Tax=Plakobranchus ocellatus TaxID=259542 RepID=A0AAV4E1R4_9GAST|nr:collagen alpha-1(xii) chain-like [Plakobranchus ocellatus]